MARPKRMDIESDNNTRVLKFEILVRDINKVIKKEDPIFNIPVFNLALGRAVKSGPLRDNTTPINLIFNNDDLNAFGKIILKEATIKIGESGTGNDYRDPWIEKYSGSDFDDERLKIIAAKDFISYCREGNNRPEGYKLLFWSLMILSVDDTDADEKLSLICDFARMLKITDDEMMDIVYTIKNIYNEVDDVYEFKTDTVPAILGNAFSLYGDVKLICPDCGSPIIASQVFCNECGAKLKA